jgi:hypothetical protein
VGNERYDTVAPSGNGLGSEVDGGHSKSSPGPEVSSSPGKRPRTFSESPYVAHSAPAPDKTALPTVSSEKLDSLTIVAHCDETDHRIVQPLGGRAFLDRNSLGR